MARDLMLNVSAFTLQVGVIAAAAALLLHVLRIASAGTRYLCWRVVLAVCLVMPLVLQRPPAPESPDLSLEDVAVSIPNPGADVRSAAETDPVSVPRREIPWTQFAGLVIGAGVCMRAAWLAIGLRRLGALRRRGLPIEDVVYDDIQATLGTRATLRSVEGLTQPATFGLWRPVVLVPDMLAEQPTELRRAVVTHELFHVQRRDWLWVLVEESIRAVLWFHPAILWLTSRIQLAREELVDELTVLATGNRKTYIEALMTFADAGQVRPAPAFARRRQLFTRIVRLSKEGVMSSPRIVVSAGFVIAAVLATAWYASHAFPIVSAAAAVPQVPPAATTGDSMPASSEEQSTPASSPNGPDWNAYLRETQRSLSVLSDSTGFAAAQGPRSGGAPRPGPAPVTIPSAGTKPITPENPIPRRLSSVAVPYPSQLRGSGYRGIVMLQVMLDASGSIADARRMASEVGGGDSTDADTRQRAVDAFFQAAVDAVRQWRYQAPADPPIAFFVTVRFDGERDATAAQSDGPIGLGARGGAGAGTATLAFLRDQLLQFEQRLETLQAERSQRAAQFGGQDQRVLELSKQINAMERELERARELQKRGGASVSTVDLGRGSAIARVVTGPGQTSAAPVRIGGNVRPPTRTKHVDPVYPEVAKVARVQGVVIMEALLDEQGRVAEARILRSIPLLDQAALDAVRQWEFTPTLLNGAAVPVVMTMTVQFSLPEQPPAF